MSVVWARDCGGWGDEPPMRMPRPVRDADREGFCGTPSHFIDVDDPKVKKYCDDSRVRGRKSFAENRELVTTLIQQGVVYPTGAMLDRVVRELRRISGS